MGDRTEETQFARVEGCCCDIDEEGNVSGDPFCPVHAENDPCSLRSLIMARPRKGSIKKKGSMLVCTSCGWSKFDKKTAESGYLLLYMKPLKNQNTNSPYL